MCASISNPRCSFSWFWLMFVCLIFVFFPSFQCISLSFVRSASCDLKCQRWETHSITHSLIQWTNHFKWFFFLALLDKRTFQCEFRNCGGTEFHDLWMPILSRTGDVMWCVMTEHYLSNWTPLFELNALCLWNWNYHSTKPIDWLHQPHVSSCWKSQTENWVQHFSISTRY